jgi:putative DNA primase/helicase
MTIDDLNKFANVKKVGDRWSARCPAHDDQHNSLSIKLEANGRLLLYCHAGCSYEDICRAAGIQRRGSREVVATYDYRDEQGVLLYQVLRYEPKGFIQRRQDGAGGWDYNLKGVRRVPYRLAQLLVADTRETIFIVEGEKDADRLASLGLVATTNAGGAGKWRAEHSEHLRGHCVGIIPDNDESGAKHATHVEQFLRGIAASVRILPLPGLPPKGDVSDWLDAGHTVEELRALATAAPESSPQKSQETSLNVVRMADVVAEDVRWLWPPYIAFGKLTILEGDPGVGKSWLTCALAAAVSLGCGLPGMETFEAGSVLMLSAEDGLGDTVRPRLDAVRADTSRVFALNEPLTFDVAGLYRLEAAIVEYSAVLVIIDPLFAFTGGNIDIHRANESRAITARLAAIAERAGCGIVAVRHLGKSRGGGHALNAGIGSIDFAAAARSVLLVGKDPDAPSECALVQIKNNLAPLGDAVGYKLEEGRFYWTGASTLTAERILSLPSDEEVRVARTEAIDFLLEALAGGPRPANDVKAEAKQIGLTEQMLKTARKKLGMKPYKVGGEFGGKGAVWIWELPDSQEGEDKDAGHHKGLIK